jgi:uncharacterized protein
MTRPSLRRPGWLEILVAAAVYALVYWAVPPLLNAATKHDDVAGGLVFAALSGLMPLAAFAVAVVIRVRDLRTFGVRSVPVRWWFIAIGTGLASLVVVRLLGVAAVAIIGNTTTGDIQGPYRAAAAAGPIPLTLLLLFLAVLTPIGEEAAFRGVLTNGHGRYGAWIAVLGSTVVFALVHSIDLALIPAVVFGVVNGTMFRRTGFIWPGVVAHAVNNGVSMVLPLILTGVAGSV